MRTRLSRRSVLRGAVAGSAVSMPLPRLGAMLDGNGTAYASGEPLPHRFGVWGWGNGVLLPRFVPKETGKAWVMTDQLAPLAPFRDMLTVITGMEVKTRGRAHGAGHTGVLTGAALAGKDDSTWTAARPSIDQLIANHVGRTTRLRSLELGVNAAGGPETGSAMHYFSHSGPNSPNVPLYNPLELWTRTFGGSTTAVTARLRKSVLDAVRADAAEIGALVGAEDRHRLDGHLEGLREIEKRLAPGVCPGPAAPASLEPPKRFGSPFDARSDEAHRLHVELLALALSCDLTRVFTYQLLKPGSTALFRTLDGSAPLRGLFHGMTHGDGLEQPNVHICVLHVMQRFAALLSRLRAIDEGGAPLLDRCAILAISDVSEGKSHSQKDFPILIAGKGGGALRTGMHHRSASENACHVPFTLATRVMGVPLTEFGDGAGKVSAGLPAIEA